MNTVKFNDKDSYKDFGILLMPKARPKPSPKYNYVSIPARSGDLDLTEALGEVQYENLSFPLDFYVVNNDWDNTLSEITNYLHGKKAKVTFSDDPDYYYLGRVTINELSSDKGAKILSLECNFEPYKYKQDVTSITHTVSAGDSYVFKNSRMSVVPKLTLSAAMTIEFNGTRYSLGAGTSKVLDIQFKYGDNTIKVITGSGTIKAEYQEGSL
jgi:predicted phage tail component-like protein